jgi:hypothetical protein
MAVWDEGGLPAATDWRTVKEELDAIAEMLPRVNDLSAFVLLFPLTLPH